MFLNAWYLVLGSDEKVKIWGIRLNPDQLLRIVWYDSVRPRRRKWRLPGQSSSSTIPRSSPPWQTKPAGILTLLKFIQLLFCSNVPTYKRNVGHQISDYSIGCILIYLFTYSNKSYLQFIISSSSTDLYNRLIITEDFVVSNSRV